MWVAGACAGNSVHRYQDTVAGKSPGGLVVLGQETGWGHMKYKDKLRVGFAQPGEGKPQVGPCCSLQPPNQRAWKTEPDSP